MARFLKLKFQIILKINFNGGQFYQKIVNFRYVFQKNSKFCSKINFEIENVENLRLATIKNFEIVLRRIM